MSIASYMRLVEEIVGLNYLVARKELLKRKPDYEVIDRKLKENEKLLERAKQNLLRWRKR